MNLPLLFSLTERLRAEALGDPNWVEEKGVFEYSNHGVETVAVLKAVRASQGVKSMQLLCTNGLFIDMGAIYRCVIDCTAEIHFLFETYPKKSVHVERFVKAFFEGTIDGRLNAETEPVPTKKIHSAVVRSLTGLIQHDGTLEKIRYVYTTFSGYTHANYAHIMEIYGGTRPNLSFNVAGVPSTQQREWRMKLVEQAYLSVLYALANIAQSLELRDLHREILQHC
jgi:hypothetical protein